MALTATKAQIAKVQTVYTQMARHEAFQATREGRLQAASQLLGRPLTSFSELKRGEAIFLIDQWQGALGIDYKPHAMPTSFAQARRAGRDGRKGDTEFTNAPQLVSAQELEIIAAFIARLGWNDVRLKAWLESPRSPFAKRTDKTIRTTADANRVRWALKGMLANQGKWESAA